MCFVKSSPDSKSEIGRRNNFEVSLGFPKIISPENGIPPLTSLFHPSITKPNNS